MKEIFSMLMRQTTDIVNPLIICKFISLCKARGNGRKRTILDISTLHCIRTIFHTDYIRRLINVTIAISSHGHNKQKNYKARDLHNTF